tara:strand:- start:10456 stop:12987 length:2532 start_codon:yes stop_codon:yes gene_type:complete
MKNLKLALALATSTLLAPGCAADDPTSQLSVSCSDGKCDGFDSIRSLITDAKKLDLGDLIVLSAGFATEGLNEALGVSDYAGVELSPTEFYALKEQVDQDLTLNDIDELVSGLAARFGDSELSTEVNRVRAEHLRDASSDDKYFAESSFTIKSDLSHGWNFSSKGLAEDGNLASSIGFDLGGDLQARVIGAYDGEVEGIRSAPLSAIRGARGFVFPRETSDIRDMRPGESYALKGEGTMGINIGAGVPILIAEPTAVLSYNVVLTAGLRSQLTGQMDVQLVRLQGDEVVIDVGMEVSSVKSARIGLRDGWGVQGLVEQDLDIAGVNVDLGRMVEKALQKQLNKKLSLIHAEASNSNTNTRMSVARMRFNLDASDPQGARDEALAQALKDDIRLAQALANRGDSGVKAEFDLLRSGVSSTSHAGIELFGMKFFTTTQEQEGSVVVQTPGGATSLIFESLHREGGWFFTSHGYGRTGLAGLIYDAESGGAARGETNLFISIQEGDDFMSRDQLLDHIDGIILTVGGKQAFAALEVHTNALENLVLDLCPVPTASDDDRFDEQCNIDILAGNAQVAQLRSTARTALEQELLHLEQEQRDLVMRAGDLKISVQSIEDPNAALVGPEASIVLDYRLDDGALQDIFSKYSGVDLQAKILDFLETTQVDRVDDDLVPTRESLRSRLDDDTEPMIEVFDDYRESYLRMLSLSNARIDTLGEIGAQALEIRFEVDSRKRADYESATSRSLAHARSELMTNFFDDLVELADDVSGTGQGSAPHEEQIVAYGLLGLTDPNRLDLRIDFAADVSGSRDERYVAAGVEDFDIRARGSLVEEIGGGLFDIDSLINLQ